MFPAHSVRWRNSHTRNWPFTVGTLPGSASPRLAEELEAPVDPQQKILTSSSSLLLLCPNFLFLHSNSSTRTSSFASFVSPLFTRPHLLCATPFAADQVQNEEGSSGQKRLVARASIASKPSMAQPPDSITVVADSVAADDGKTISDVLIDQERGQRPEDYDVQTVERVYRYDTYMDTAKYPTLLLTRSLGNLI